MTQPQRPPLHLAVALDGAGWHPAAWREPRRPARRAAVRPVLGRPGRRGRARPARLRHHRGLARPAVEPAAGPDRGDRPGARPAGRGADRRPGRPADPRTSGWSRPWSSRTPSRSTSPRPSPPWTTSAAAGPGSGSRSRPGRTRPRTSAAARSRSPSPRRGVAGHGDRAVRRGGRLRRGGPAAVGQLGGRRRDPRRRHRPVRRPRQAALHRLRGPLVQRPRARRSRPARRRASRWSPRWPTATRALPAGRPLRRPRLRHPARRRAGRRGHRRRDPRSARRPPAAPAGTVHVFGRPGGLPRRRPPGPPPPAAPGWTSWPGPPYRSDAAIFAGTPAELADLLLDWQAAGLAGFRLRPAALPHDLTQITRGLVPELQRRGAFRRGYEAGHPARPARPGPPRQPLRRLEPERSRRHDHAAQADPPRRALPRREQHHGVERPGGRAATSTSPRSRTSRRPPSGPSSTSSSWPRGCGCASRTARSTTSTSSAGPTPSPCWPRWPRSPSRLGPDRHHQLHLQRAVRGGPPVRQPRPPVRRPGGLERGHLLGRVHRRELPPRRLPAPRRSATSGPRSSCATACELFDSWRGDEIVADQDVRASSWPTRPPGAFAHHDAHFDISGQFNVPRSPQGRPVIFQAGDSDEGREFAAASADAIFSRHSHAATTGQAFYADVKGRLARYGRVPRRAADPARGHLRARRHRRRGRTSWPARSAASRSAAQTAIKFLEQLWNRDLSGYDPDGPLPEIDPDPGENTIARGRASVRMHRDPLATARAVARAGRGREPVASAS